MGERRLVAFRREQEFARRDLRALVEKLEKGVLPVRARLAPDHGAGGPGKWAAIHRHALAVRFHLELLEIGGQARKPLVVGQDGAGRVAADLVVPDADEGEHHRHVLLERRGAEMGVHRRGALEEGAEIVGADGDHQAQPDRPPDRVAPADPILEREDAAAVDAEGGGAVERRGKRHELPGRIAATHHPVARGAGIGHRLGGGEGLRGDDDERCLGVQPVQGVVEMRAVDIRDEMAARPVDIGGERLHRHRRAEVRAADADIDHVGDPPGGAADPPVAQVAGEGFHPSQRATDLRDDVLAIHRHRAVEIAQRSVQHRTILGLVDALA
jgi:hypothetical protein